MSWKFCFYLISGTPAAPSGGQAQLSFPQDTTKSNKHIELMGEKESYFLKLGGKWCGQKGNESTFKVDFSNAGTTF